MVRAQGGVLPDTIFVALAMSREECVRRIAQPFGIGVTRDGAVEVGLAMSDDVGTAIGMVGDCVARDAPCRVMFFGSVKDASSLRELVRAGIAHIVAEPACPDRLLEGLLETHRQTLVLRALLRPHVAAALGETEGQLGPRFRVEHGLPPQQARVLGLVRRGLSNAEIARELRVSVPSVKKYVSALLERFNVRSRHVLADKVGTVAARDRGERRAAAGAGRSARAAV